MPFDVKIILPNDLKSDFLKAEFLEQGTAYNTDIFKNDPNVDQNKVNLVFSFELRDKSTRELVTLARIKELTLSNDPSFDASAVVKIQNLPEYPLSFDSEKNYTYNLNHSYFFDNTLSQEITPRPLPSAGTGLFYINNWHLSANGGLSRVYIKAIIEGPGGQTAEYPGGYALYDEVLWQGEIPVSPENPSFSSLKTGWVGKDTLITFTPGSDSSTAKYSNGIQSYLLSSYSISAIGNTYNLQTTKSSVKRSILPSASVGASTLTSYSFYRNGSSTYALKTLSVGSSIALTSYAASRGAFFYTDSKYSSTSNDIFAQAAFNYSISSIGASSQTFLKIYDQKDTAANSKEIVCRIDIPNDSYPTAYLYSITNNTESAQKQTTILPPNMLPLLQSGGLMEMYYSNLDSNYSYVEAYFTPYLDQGSVASKSYLLANSIMSSLGNTTLGSAFGYQMIGATGTTGTIKLDELMIAQGKSKLSADIGDCSLKDNNNINYPITEILTNWSLYNEDEYKILSEAPAGLSITSNIATSYLEVSKIDSTDLYAPVATYEVQLMKPSMSNRSRLDFTILHRSDDMYVAFSPVSSYRPHNEDGRMVYWDRPFGTRIDQNFALSDEPINAATIMVKFSADKNIIQILQRNEDNTFTKHSLKTYIPSASGDNYSIEITDQAPDGVVGTKKRKAANSTWIYVKKYAGANLELIGYAQLANKLHPNNLGLGYYAAIGFRESTYSVGTNRLSTLSFYSLPKFNNNRFDVEERKSTFLLSDEGLSNSKHYLGVKTLSSSTDFVGFNYSTPIYNSSYFSIKAATTGENVNITNINSATIDGVILSTIANGTYVLIKDQIVKSENGLYLKTGSTFTYVNPAYAVPLRIASGTQNINTTWYKQQIDSGGEIVDRFICTAFFKDITVGEISSFVSSIVPGLLEFKLLWNKYDKVFPYDEFQIRFFDDNSEYPGSPLTSWLNTDTLPLNDTFAPSPNNSLIQFPIDYTTLTSLSVSSGTKIWVLINIPFGSSLGEANGTAYNSPYIDTGSYVGYRLAKNLWHKLFARYVEKSTNSNHKDIQQFRVRAISHANVSSMSTNISSETKVDILGPLNGGDVPLITKQNNSTLRTAVLSILATDSDSGLMAFRVGKEIDNSNIDYTPWLSWSEYTQGNSELYTVYLNGHLNYYDSGQLDTVFQLQNVGFSGSRKIWVQVMDYAGNVSESYPLTFIAKTWCLVDTEAPSGTISFYDPEKLQLVTTTNGSNLGGVGSTNISSWIKLEGTDVVSGIKDFKIRRIYDNGPAAWSTFEYYNPYRIIDFTGELDGVKKVEVAFRDFGNNIVQPEITWKKITRPIK